MTEGVAIHLDAELSAGGVLERREAGTIVFSQGDRAGAVYFACRGRLTRSVFSAGGNHTIIGIVAPGDVFGENVLLGAPDRAVTVATIDDCLLLRFERQAIQLKMEKNPRFAAYFLERVLHSKLRAEEALAQDRFLPSECRLARTLLNLAGLPQAGDTGTLPKITQETLAAMVGTTRPRVSTFMARFRALGHLEERDGTTTVRISLQTLAQA